MENINDRIKSLTKEIGLPGIRKNYEILLDEFSGKESEYNLFLHKLLEVEYMSRLKSRKASRIRLAGFPYKKHLEDLKTEDLPVNAKTKLEELEELDFIKQGRNIIFAGNPGTGKTHIAIGLGIKACNENYKVLFTTVPRLITKIKECRSEQTLKQLENQFEKYDLVICDEFGYISFDKEGAELLFSHLSLRAGIKSTIITTNLSFDRWNEIFGDTILTAAMVDRLTHKAHLINMNGKSYRTKETLQYANKLSENE
ncbi:MAG: IS21-like element helper ATPase IstB [Bacteroidales bacterium]|jgi:DNA replication protein DnaC|nr:IS21-like element helper ATPase IstB [Bacteroidales bacterium]